MPPEAYPPGSASGEAPSVRIPVAATPKCYPQRAGPNRELPPFAYSYAIARRTFTRAARIAGRTAATTPTAAASTK